MSTPFINAKILDMESKIHRTSEGKAAKLSEIVRLLNEKNDRDKSTDHDERSFWVLQNGVWGKVNESWVMDAPIIEHIHGRKKEVTLEWNNLSLSTTEDDHKANATNALTQNDISPKNGQPQHNSNNLREKQNDMKTQTCQIPAMSLIRNNPKFSIGFIALNCLIFAMIMIICCCCKTKYQKMIKNQEIIHHQGIQVFLYCVKLWKDKQ